jgi:epimerase transport system membrane fusion protein
MRALDARPPGAPKLTLVRPQAARTTQQHARRLVGLGWWIVFGAIVPVGVWMSIAPLSMAVVAPAVVRVELNRRPVQHLEGGIVRKVLVRDGQRVKAGQPVLILGDVGVDADRNRITYRVNTERAALVRHEAEQALASALVFPGDLRAVAGRDPRVNEAIMKETALFEARRDSLRSELGLMKAQREQVQHEVSALRGQIAQAESSLALQNSELDTNRELVKRGYLAPMRIVQLEAVVLDYAGKLEERRSELARASQRLVETDLKMKSVQNDYVKVASDQVKGTAARLTEIEQELRKSVDAAGRQVVVAPASGEIIDLKFTSPGAVVRPGEPIAEIVPGEDNLVVEAHIRPEEISHVYIDQPARIRFTAFKYRSTSMVTGKVTQISGDRLIERGSNLPYYNVIIIADPESLQAAAGDSKLQAGMPAEVYLEGAPQTPLQYLAEPITSRIRKAGRPL